MEARCGSCNKLFRVSDDKVTGTGIKFKCSRCGEYVKITSEDFEKYKHSPAGVSATDKFAPKPIPAKPSPEPAAAAVQKPAVQAELKPETKPPVKPEAKPQAKPEPKPSIKPEPKSEPVKTAVPPAAETAPAPTPPPPREAARPAPSLAGKSAPVQPSAHAAADTVHPFVSGASAGALGGAGCALPVLVLMLLGFGLISSFVSKSSAGIPVAYSVALALSSFIGTGIIIGIVLSVIQARSDREMFSFIGVLTGAVVGAAIGGLLGAAGALGAGSLMSAMVIIGSSVKWGIKALLISIVVVFIRRQMMSSKQMSFSSALSGAQTLGLVLSVSIVAFAIYGEVSQLRNVTEGVSGAVKDMTSTEGLQITGSMGALDAKNDLVISFTVENTTDQEKPVWYAVAEIYDAQNNVLVKARMISGKQLYSQKDYDILAKRGDNVQELMMKRLQEKELPIPPKGTVSAEIRIMEPPVGIASFLVTLQPFDPIQMMKEAAEEMKQKPQGQ